MVHYLSASDIYTINEAVVGHRPFVRERRLLLSAAQRPAIVLFGQEQFPTLIDKAAALMHSLAYHHLFGDGNKRTALIAVQRFLELNASPPRWDEAAAQRYILSVAQGDQSVEQIAQWLREHA